MTGKSARKIDRQAMNFGGLRCQEAQFASDGNAAKRRMAIYIKLVNISVYARKCSRHVIDFDDHMIMTVQCVDIQFTGDEEVH
jgi:hypothetical protein